MAEVELECAVYGEGTVFPVKIASNAKVSALQEKIASTYRVVSNRVEVYPARLTLYLARKEGEATWMNHDHTVKGFLRGGISTEYEEMLSSWILDEDCFGKNFQPGRKEIHVLVELPQLSEAELPRDRQLVVGDVHIPITQSMSLNPPALVAFRKAFLNDSTDVKAGALVELPRDTYLLGDSTLGSRIYIRHCYPALWELCLERIHDEKTNTPHLVILGNPGIGKTFFGYVIVLHLVRTNETVVYESGGLKKRFLFAHNVVAQGSQEDFVHILDQPTTYYIVDAVKPAYYPAKTILLTLPRRSIWYEFNKTNCRSCYMPVWSLKEILQCRKLMYSDTPMAVVQDCFRRWGGIARYVLRFSQVGDQQVLLEKAMDIVDLDWLVKACGQLDANDAQVSHRLLHYRVSKAFDSEYFVFASQYVQQEVYNRLYKKDKRKLLEFIAASDGVGALAVLRGHLFEGHVHSVLPRGGTFRVRRLVENNEAYDDDDDDLMEDEWDGDDEDGDDGMNADDAVAMDESNAVALVDGGAAPVISFERFEKVVVFNDDSEIEAATNTSYLQPAVKNYQSVDAIIKPDILLQVTGAHKHPCKQKGLHDVLKLLGNPEQPRLFFVLPPDRFTDFNYQKYLDSKRKRMMAPSYENVCKIQQFAMEVKLESE
ncbi:crinkler (CRN) family protein, putative [Phytophthora infestans T30-4]|uniref:Crinkler (CRN) family protein, putative n=1 Tax=Phytophthora infestans (strain T30-4) TaxID=403677 RepID=D0NWH4_PHYIT|nr:crinkler (CRN) family protein, putative [Phytophthora infestans T30-4]EEY67030.1 crinkler (CRN) family protein, putative [Phytophthora infestans T30-4]|eukprot:XP_002896584.1 crinkler (CRN) family protein, putative [Phytophthora infestans T30-4]